MKLKQLRRTYPYPLKVLKRINELIENKDIKISDAAEIASREYAETMKHRPVLYSVWGTAHSCNHFAIVELMVETICNANSVYLRQLANHFALVALRQNENAIKNMDFSSIIARCGENVKLSNVKVIFSEGGTVGLYNHFGKHVSYAVLSGISGSDAQSLADDIAKAAMRYYPEYIKKYTERIPIYSDDGPNVIHIRPLRYEERFSENAPCFADYLLNKSICKNDSSNICSIKTVFTFFGENIKIYKVGIWNSTF